MARKEDLENMSIKQLRELKAEVEAAILSRQKVERQSLKERMERMADEAGLSLDDIFGKGGRGRGKAGIKFRNPDNVGETWSGRGRRPKWLEEKLAKKGVSVEDFRV